MTKLGMYIVYIGQSIMRYQAMLVGVAIVGSLIFGRFNLTTIGYYWAMIGGALFTFSLFSLSGAFSSTRSFQYQYGMSIGEDIVDRTNRIQQELRGVESVVMSSYIQAVVAIIGGLTLNALAHM